MSVQSSITTPQISNPSERKNQAREKGAIKILQLNCYVLVKRKRQVSQQDTCSRLFIEDTFSTPLNMFHIGEIPY